MGSVGREVTDTGGRKISVVAAGVPQRPVGGITLDWSTVTAVGSETTLPSGRVIPAGEKYLPAGRVLCRITASGKYGPYDSGAADGRQNLNRSECFILEEELVKSDLMSDHPPVLDGGYVYRTRVVGVSNNPSEANCETAFPEIKWVF